MPLNTNRLKDRIKTAYHLAAQVDTTAEEGLDRFAEALSEAIVDEIKQLSILYNGGLMAPNGSVGGTINHSVS